MVAPSIVNSGPALLRKTRADFVNTWKTHYEAAKSRMPFVQFGLSTDDFQTAFGYGTTPVYPANTGWGEKPQGRPHEYLTYTVEQLRWTSEVNWLVRDRELSNLGTIDRDALAAGRNFGTLFERIFYQILAAGTDPQLLENVPNAPDGAALFAATAGGLDRFGVSGGNIVSGQSFTTGAGIEAGLYEALERMGQFEDTQGQPSCDDGVFEAGVTYLAPITLAREVHQAFKQRYVKSDQAAAGDSTQVSNLVMDAGIPVRLILTPRLTGSAAYVISDYIHGSEGEPLIAEVVSQPLVEHYFDASNSKENAQTGVEGALWEHWMAPAVNLPRGAVQLTT